MTVDAWLTLAVIAGVLGLLVRTSLSPALVIFGATVSLLVLGVIDTEQALSGFSNPAPFTVAALYVVAAAVQKTGALTPIMQRTLGRAGLVPASPAAGAASDGGVVGVPQQHPHRGDAHPADLVVG